MATILWGVDSAARVTPELFNCVVSNYGQPRYWGRYLTTVPNVSDGLTEEEVRFLHSKQVKILPIYNDFREAVGYNRGRITARNTIFHAQRLGIPKNTFLFANIEKFFEVNEAWIRGWVEAMFPSGYRPGLYVDTSSQNFNAAYCTAVSNNPKVSDQTVLWSQEPTPGVTTKQNAPAYAPVMPPCIANVWAWQYGENAPDCPIDTNLMDKRLFDNLW